MYCGTVDEMVDSCGVYADESLDASCLVTNVGGLFFDVGGPVFDVSSFIFNVFCSISDADGFILVNVDSRLDKVF